MLGRGDTPSSWPASCLPRLVPRHHLTPPSLTSIERSGTSQYPPYSLQNAAKSKILTPVDSFMYKGTWSWRRRRSVRSHDVLVVLFRCTHHTTVVILHLHRPYFAQALSDMPHDLLKHRFGPSLMATYRSSWRLIEALRDLHRRAPFILGRIPLPWSYSISAAVSLFSPPFVMKGRLKCSLDRHVSAGYTRTNVSPCSGLSARAGQAGRYVRKVCQHIADSLHQFGMDYNLCVHYDCSHYRRKSCKDSSAKHGRQRLDTKLRTVHILRSVSSIASAARRDSSRPTCTASPASHRQIRVTPRVAGRHPPWNPHHRRPHRRPSLALQPRQRPRTFIHCSSQICARLRTSTPVPRRRTLPCPQWTSTLTSRKRSRSRSSRSTGTTMRIESNKSNSSRSNNTRCPISQTFCRRCPTLLDILTSNSMVRCQWISLAVLNSRSIKCLLLVCRACRCLCWTRRGSRSWNSLDSERDDLYELVLYLYMDNYCIVMDTELDSMLPHDYNKLSLYATLCPNKHGRETKHTNRKEKEQ